MLEWLWPWVFAAAPLPWLVYRLSKGESLQPSALRAPFAARWQGLAGASRSMRSGRGYWWLLWLTWMMLIVATARPQWIGEPIELPNTGRDLMLGLDLSGSMQIEDMQVGNRLVPRITAVKAIAADFTERRQGDRVGLILFGTRAYLQAPLTFDLSTVTRFIDEAQLGFAGEDTAIGDALGLDRLLLPVKNTRGGIGKKAMIHNAMTPEMEVDPETYEVRANGELLTCEPAKVLPLAQRYFLF